MFSFVLGSVSRTRFAARKFDQGELSEAAAHPKILWRVDPFGDFRLLFGAARMALRIVEVPVHYRERTYGETNIQRWRHGVILCEC